MQNETCTVLPMQSTYPLKWLRCKSVLTLEQVSDHCRQPSPLDSHQEHRTLAAAWLKPGAKSVSLERPFPCSGPQCLPKEKENGHACLCQGVRKTSVRNVSAFKGQIFCTSAEFIFILSVSWTEENIFFIVLLSFLLQASSEHTVCAGGGEAER